MATESKKSSSSKLKSVDASRARRAKTRRKSSGCLHRQIVQSKLTDETEEDSYLSTALPRLVDRAYHAFLARVSGGLSPGAIASAYADWLIHLSLSPGKVLQLNEKMVRKTIRLQKYLIACASNKSDTNACIEPLPQDQRFRSAEWQRWPFNIGYQAFLLNQQWWYNATTGVRGVNRRHEMIVEFVTRQLLDICSPSNFLSTNPELINRTVRENGANLARGAFNFVEDWQHLASGGAAAVPEGFEVGKTLAATPGKVVYRNDLIELIQYEPMTKKVHREPILFVPAWIMKYYILDLSAHNSLVRYLLEQGYTVFMISWKNPGSPYRNFGMDDYLNLGVFDALDVASSISESQKVHCAGYCLGGTLLSIAAAAMARDGDDRLGSMTLLAAQVDFTEPGELELFINESEVSFLEDMMWEQGYLDSKQMVGTFQLLRSNDLIWSRMVQEYLQGERPSVIDLMAWNADSTRMPYRMHSEYLRKLFLNNDLAEGRYEVGGLPVALADVDVPAFIVGTIKDHIAPWKSVYKFHLFVDSPITFVLTGGGHNAGIVSEPGHQGRQYQITQQNVNGQYIDPETWTKQVPRQDGSWWPEWAAWLSGRAGRLCDPPGMGSDPLGYEVLCDAPGNYVLER